MSSRKDIAKARAALAKTGGDRVDRQIFLCSVSEKQKCCKRDEGKAAWAFLKRRLKELELVGPQTADGKGGIQRAKADCLQVCAAGPIAVIWPDNVWYHSCDETVLEQIIQRHLIGGAVVEEFRLAAEPAD